MSKQNSTTEAHVKFTLEQFVLDDTPFETPCVYEDKFYVATDCSVCLILNKTYIDHAIGGALDYPQWGEKSDKIETFVQHMAGVDEYDTYSCDELEIACAESESSKQLSGVCLAPNLFGPKKVRKMIMMARLLGASSVNISEKQDERNNGAVYFRFFDDANHVIAGGLITPLIPTILDTCKRFSVTRSIPTFDEPIVSLPSGAAYMERLIAEREEAKRQNEPQKKVWNVTVMKVGFVAVEAVTEDQARQLVDDNYINDRVFWESDVEIGPYCPQEMCDEEIGEAGDSDTYKREGILTEHGWQSWDDWYNANGWE